MIGKILNIGIHVQYMIQYELLFETSQIYPFLTSQIVQFSNLYIAMIFVEYRK